MMLELLIKIPVAGENSRQAGKVPAVF